MADTNFSIWNPTAANQENDSTYQGDAQRTGGAVSGVFASALANKVFYQPSLWIRAFALSLVGKGFSPKDGTSPYVADTSSNTAATALKTILDNILTTTDRPLSPRFTTFTSHTGDTTLDTIATLTLPALLPNQVLRVTVVLGVGAQGAGTTQVSLVFGAGSISLGQITTTTGTGPYTFVLHIDNTGSVSSQRVNGYQVVPGGIVSGVNEGTDSVNTGVSITCSLQIQNANNSDQQSVSLFLIEII